MKENPGNLVILDFYEETHDIRARFYCPPGYRVLDALNELIIRKESVQFVTADDGDAGRGFNPDPGFKNPRKIEKVPVKVGIQLKNYLLTGNMHQVQKKKFEDTLAEYAQFVPMTDVTIMRNSELVAKKPFAAVNKKYIVAIKEMAEEENPAPDSMPEISD